MTTGLEEFKKILAEFRGGPLWTGLATASLPLISAFAGMMPGWPRGLQYVTAVVVLLAVMFIFQKFQFSPRERATKNIQFLLVGTSSILAIYAVAFSLFSIRIPGSGEQVIIGFACSAMAAETYGSACPFLGIEELKKAQFNELALWSKPSISLVRTGILILWCSLFGMISALIAQFLVFQRSAKAPYP